MGSKSQSKDPPLGELYIIDYSPWATMSVLAMFYCRLENKISVLPYRPNVSSLARRLKMDKLSLTSPLLILPDGRHIMESFDISQWINDKRSTSAKSDLFPTGLSGSIAQWNKRSSNIAAWHRNQVLESMLTDDAKLDALLSLPWLLQCFGPLMRKLVRREISKLKDKYESSATGLTQESVMEDVRAIQSALEESGYTTILGDQEGSGQLTYADICVAEVLLVLEPQRELPIFESPMSSAQFKIMGSPELRAPLSDAVFQWRQRVIDMVVAREGQ